jgi:transcriptional regulator with XRE-family HTH domain
VIFEHQGLVLLGSISPWFPSEGKKMPIGKVFEELRRSRKLTQLEVADRLGTSQREISFIENGKRGLKPQVFHDFMECLSKERFISAAEWTQVYISTVLDSLTLVLSGETPTITTQEDSDESFGSVLMQLPDDRLFMVEVMAMPRDADIQLAKRSAGILRSILALPPKSREVIVGLLGMMSKKEGL